MLQQGNKTNKGMKAQMSFATLRISVFPICAKINLFDLASNETNIPYILREIQIKLANSSKVFGQNSHFLKKREFLSSKCSC